MHLNFIVSNFYKFKSFKNIDQLKFNLKNKIQGFDVKGSFLIGNEGINGSFSVPEKEFELVKHELNQLFDENFTFKKQQHSSHAFLRLKIRLKKEIVTMGDKTIKSNNAHGTYTF